MQGPDDKPVQLPTLTRGQLEQLSKPQLIGIVLLLQDRLRVLEERNQKLEARVAELERQLGQNSSNSSKPPSSDPPWLPSKKKPKTGHKPGGQPGHEGHHRELVNADQVADLRKVFPVQSCNCGAKLPRDESDPRRYQWLELPEVVEPELHEFQLFSSVCPRCGKVHVATLPQGTPTGAFGPRVHALVTLLTGVYRLSKRKARALLLDLYRLDISLGSISA